MPSTLQLIASVEININGLKINRITSLSISQPFDNHHSFEISLSPDMLPDKSSTVKLKELGDKVMGETVVIKLAQGEKAKDGTVSKQQTMVFNGIVTAVRLSKGSSTSNTIIITGVSPTALLSAGRTTRSFSKLTLEQIVNKVLKPYGDLKKNVRPEWKERIRYVTQYEEDNFHFLQRLAEDCGEWMYYDGQQFVFGKAGRVKGEEIVLKHAANFFDMNYSMRATPLNLNGFYYDYYTNTTYEAPSSAESVSGLNSYEQIGLNKSEKVFSDELIEIGYQNHRSTSTLKKAIKGKKSEQANKLAVLTGRTPEMEVKLGGVVKVTDTFINADNKVETIDYGSFVVTRLSHYLDSRGVYQCNFEAVPHDTDFAPVDYRIIQPNAEPQPAVVMQVDDKDSMGRVKVQFPWQKATNEKTPWVRVVNPMASKEKGMYFIPEVDEVVFVDFEFGNPDIPFVTGSMYHGDAKPGDLFNKNNNIKGIITKGGNHILIDDTEGEEKIRIFNKDSKNEIELSLDGGSHIRAKSNGTIFLEAAKGIQMKAPKIKMEASDEWEVKAGKTLIKNDTSMEVSAGAELKAEGLTVDLNAQTTGSFKASTQLELDGGGMATLKGGMVMIN
ncbi:MAG: phage baseplate assembly protein V [Spirosomataceae bacterium]